MVPRNYVEEVAKKTSDITSSHSVMKVTVTDENMKRGLSDFKQTQMLLKIDLCLLVVEPVVKRARKFP